MERTAFCLLLHTLHMYWFSPSSFSSCTQRMHTAWFESNLAWTVMPSGLKILKQKWLLEFRLVSTYIHLAWTQIIRFEHIHCRNIHYLAQIHTLPKIHNLVWTYTLPVFCCVYEHTHCPSFAVFTNIHTACPLLGFTFRKSCSDDIRVLCPRMLTSNS